MRKVGSAIPAIAVGLAVRDECSFGGRTFRLLLPAGQACEAFTSGPNITPNPHRVFKEFGDAEGNLVRTIEAGNGVELLFTNVDTGKTVTLKDNGSVSKKT